MTFPYSPIKTTPFYIGTSYTDGITDVYNISRYKIHNTFYWVEDAQGNPIDSLSISLTCPDCGGKLERMNPKEN